MNKLTTIKTITKAAPLALLAVVMSGSAFAGGKGPQGSINVFTECTLQYDDGGAFLRAASTITDVSQDTDTDPNDPVFTAVIESATASALQKGMRGPTNPVAGATDVPMILDEDENSETFGKYVAKLYFCDGLGSNPKALNADIDVELATRNKSFGGRCDDDPDTHCWDYSTDPATPVYCEEEDESIIDISYYDPC
jgi:hypothetical protein